MSNHYDPDDPAWSSLRAKPVDETTIKHADGGETTVTKHGVKYDAGKPRWSLLPWRQLQRVVDVLERGAEKYAPDNWKHVKPARERYFDATLRHLTAWWTGERLDPETQLPHLAHAVCCLLFLMWFDEPAP